MRIAIHQSQYLPWPPYFKKIAAADVFVVLDAVQYQKNGVQNRNKIRNKTQDFWITVPVTGSATDSIQEKRLVQTNWQVKHWQSLKSSYGKSKFWSLYSQDLEQLYQQPFTTLGQVNDAFLSFFMKSLGLSTRILMQSSLATQCKASDLVLEICRKLDAKTYISGMGAKAYLNEASFRDAGIEIDYLPSQSPNYTQFHAAPFIPDLSIVDMMFSVDQEVITNYLFDGKTK